MFLSVGCFFFCFFVFWFGLFFFVLVCVVMLKEVGERTMEGF